MCWGAFCTVPAFGSTLDYDNYRGQGSGSQVARDRRRSAGCLPSPNRCSVQWSRKILPVTRAYFVNRRGRTHPTHEREKIATSIHSRALLSQMLVVKSPDASSRNTIVVSTIMRGRLFFQPDREQVKVPYSAPTSRETATTFHASSSLSSATLEHRA